MYRFKKYHNSHLLTKANQILNIFMIDLHVRAISQKFISLILSKFIKISFWTGRKAGSIRLQNKLFLNQTSLFKINLFEERLNFFKSRRQPLIVYFFKVFHYSLYMEKKLLKLLILFFYHYNFYIYF